MQMINARGCFKSGEWIAQQCREVMDDVCSVSPNTSVIGFVMDSAAANRKAYTLMQEACTASESPLPPLILLPCASHTLSLLLKDIVGNFSWVSEVYADAIEISKALRNETVFSHYMDACNAENCKPLSVFTHSETRFGSQHLVLRSVMKVLAPVRKMCGYESFEDLAKDSQFAQKLIDIIRPHSEKSFRSRAPIVEELMAPIMDEIHRLEADKPMLSYMLPVVQDLMQHAETFSAKYPATFSEQNTNLALLDDPDYETDSDLGDCENLCSVFSKRLHGFYMKDCMVAAYMLDPANFVTSNQEGTFYLPWKSIVDDQLIMNQFVDEVQRLGGDEAVSQLMNVRSSGIKFKNRLDLFSAKQCVAAAQAKAGEVATIAAVHVRQDLWRYALKKVFPDLAVVAIKLLSMHVTSCAAERNLSQFGRLYDKLSSRRSVERADKMVFVKQSRVSDTAAIRCEEEDVLVSEIEAMVFEENCVAPVEVDD